MGPGSGSSYLLRLIKLAAEKYKINLKVPFEQLTKAQQDLLLYGPPKGETGRTGFHGIFAYLRSNLDDTQVGGLSRVHDAVHVGDDVPALQGAAAAAGVAGGDGADRRQGRCRLRTLRRCRWSGR